MVKGALSVTRYLSPLLRVGIIAGIVISASIYPIAALGGLGAKAGAEFLNALPTVLAVTPPAQTSYVYANDGKTLLTMFYEEHRRYTPITEISPYIQQAIVASEDGRFYEHDGVDARGVARAFVANTQAGEVEQGASTLTMQYVRMALRDAATTAAEVQAATEQTAGRKIREAGLAIEVERDLSKTAILERYLNHAYFGHRAYGIFAAAEIFYSKRPENLTLNESATLAGLVQAPSAYDPASQDQQAATDRRNWVIDRMRQLGYVSKEIAEEEKAKPISLELTDPRNDCVSATRNNWGFFCDMFRSWWQSQPAFGDHPYERLQRLRRGGYTIVTSLDPDIQSVAQRHVVANQRRGSPYAHGTAVIEPGTGLVKAMAVNRTYSLDQSGNGPHTHPRSAATSSYPKTVTPLLGGGDDLAGYQAGSTFKWFTMLAALEAGMPLSTEIDSPRLYKSGYPASPGEPGSCGDGRWCVQNASTSMTGTHTMWQAFGKSVNTYWVQLQEKVGSENAVRMAENLGLTWRTDVDQAMAKSERAGKWGAFTLGVADTTPLEMANAYATAAADGSYCEPLPVLSIKDRDGEQATRQNSEGERVAVADPRCRQAMDEQSARAATDAARCVTGYKAARGSCGSWSTAPQVYETVGRPVAGKTGTTDGNRTAWFIGYTPELAAASFIADPDNPLNPVGAANSAAPSRSVAWTLRDALEGEPVSRFDPPSGSVVD